MLQFTVKILLTLFLCTQTSLAFASTCDRFMSHQVVSDHTVVTFTYGYTNVVTYPEALSSLELVQADRLVIDQITGFLRQDESYIQRLSIEDIKIILQVFQRYEYHATLKGFQGDSSLISLKDPEILTHAVLEFYNTENPLRARHAIRRIRGSKGEHQGISPAVQYRYGRILRHLIPFYVELGDQETVDRLIQLVNSRYTPR